MTVLVAYDGSDPAQAAVKYAIEEHADKEIVLLRVIEVASGMTDAGINIIQERFREKPEKVKKEARQEVGRQTADLFEEAGIEYETEIVFGEPAREIVAYAEANDIDQIVIGNHGRSGVSRVLLGSVGEKVVRRAPMPVTVVRGRD
ncbi:universal stress protein [Halovenus sp. WSH3]|uniref:Universal stress protein n=1 Tax=Halovenus carboxidivorans TaxID=2692199 RepID=A0A6B0T8R3_9EURY|nr:universal stress protein [Halovenus carboxidivorans]MXR51250.1 universal stress protein [Halovenus carboxidivorans]